MPLTVRLLCVILYLMKDENETTHFIVTTNNGTRWAETAVSFGQVRRNFFGKHFGSGMTIAKIEKGRLFTPEEEEEMRQEKIREMSR